MTIQISKYSSRISPADVAEIRAAPLSVTHVELARRFGVVATTVARIRRGLTWPVDRPQEVRVLVPSAIVAGLEEAARRAGVTPAELLAEAAARAARSDDQGPERPPASE